MYLPFDEWRLLAGYYCMIGEINRQQTHHEGRLGYLFKRFRWSLKVPAYGELSENTDNFSKESVVPYMNGMNRAEAANRHLAARGLITLEPDQHEMSVVVVALTVEGYDLGRKYSCWLTRSGLWFAQFSQHWLWLLAATLGGGIVSKLIDHLLGDK